MPEAVVPHFITLQRIEEIPELVSFWNFQQGPREFEAVQGIPYTLQSQTGDLSVEPAEGCPAGSRALRLTEGQWLRIARDECPALDFHGSSRPFSILAWLKREKKSNKECEFIGGMWNETEGGRQYGLFLNIGVWKQHDQVCGHLSHTGGPTPGYRYCMDGPVGRSPVPLDRWTTVGMSFDGMQGYAWLNGLLDAREGLNPYPMQGGLHDGGTNGSDFTVGAVNRSGAMGNFFVGLLGGLAIFNRALTPAEMYALAHFQTKEY